MVQAKKWVLAKLFQGVVGVDSFRIEEEDLPDLQPGEFLCEAVYFNVLPSLRAFSGLSLKIGDTISCHQLSYVTQSRNGEYPVGSRLICMFGWRTHTVVTQAMRERRHPMFPKIEPVMPIPDISSLPLSYCIGGMGLEGATAYLGVTNICQPKEGETFFVNAAAGATGSIVGQIAKIKGCTVIGCAGSDEKCKWLTEELGFDHAINYKTQDVDQQLKVLAPKGIDCFFDNVGGGMAAMVIIKYMNHFGRVACCGAISQYNEGTSVSKELSQMASGPYVFGSLIHKSITMQGFMVPQWWDRYYESAHQIRDWILEGKLKYRQTMTEGFETAPQCFVDMMAGRNIGKAIVKVSSVLDM